LGGVFGEGGVERASEEVGVLLGEDQWGAEFQDIVVRAVSTGEDAAVAEPIDDVGGLIGSGCANFAI
jgi:hypothetical protein